MVYNYCYIIITTTTAEQQVGYARPTPLVRQVVTSTEFLTGLPYPPVLAALLSGFVASSNPAWT